MELSGECPWVQFLVIHIYVHACTYTHNKICCLKEKFTLIQDEVDQVGNKETNEKAVRIIQVRNEDLIQIKGAIVEMKIMLRKGLDSKMLRKQNLRAQSYLRSKTDKGQFAGFWKK